MDDMDDSAFYEFFGAVDMATVRRLLDAWRRVKPNPTEADLVFVLALMLGQVMARSPDEARPEMAEAFNAVLHATLHNPETRH